MQAYLAGRGISTATASAFRMDGISAADLDRLLTPRQRSCTQGLWLPCRDPREPAVVVGVIRLTPAQHKHAFVGRPAGLACPAAACQAERVVLVDNPLLGMRLYQAGLAGVAIVDDPCVLPPLADWLAERQVVLVALKAAGLAAMRAALGERGASVPGLLVPAEVERLTDAARTTLGLPLRCPTPPPSEPLALTTVRDLYAYAVRQLETEAGMAALRAAQWDHPDIVAAYRPGFLPERYRDLLPAAQRHHFGRAWKGHVLVLPAFDEHQVVVDLFAFKSQTNHVATSLWSAPRGLLAPILATACDHLIVTDSPRRVPRLRRDGIPPMLLRGVADAQHNAASLVAGGVQSVDIHARTGGEAIGAALAAAGLTIDVARPYAAARRAGHPASAGAAAVAAAPTATPTVPSVPTASVVAVAVAVDTVVSDAGASAEPALASVPAPAPPSAVAPPPLPTLVLVSQDRQAEQAVFRFGAGIYTVTIPPRPTSTLAIRVDGPRKSLPTRCDLAVEAARKRNAAMLALSTGLPGPEVNAALVALLPAVLALVEPTAPSIAPRTPTTIPMRADERDEAEALLRSDDLLPQVLTALGHLGADADDPATTCALLAALSRLGERPLWMALMGTMPGERFAAMAAIAQATPPDQVVHVARLTAEALNHHDADALRHRLLILGDAAEISERAALSLRLFHDRGVLTTSTVERSGAYGGLRTRVAEVHGPIAVLATTATALPHGLDHHLFSVPVDDSPAAEVRQRQAAVTPLGSPATLAAAQRLRTAAIRRLQNAQRLLIPRPVAIPDLAAIALPAALARSRLHHDTLVGLIQASALLHQHQRPTVEGCIVATGADTDLAIRLLHHVAALQAGGMSRQAHRMLTTLWAAQRTRFTMGDLDALLPGWTRWAYRTALQELTTLDYVAAGRGGRGTARTYTLIATAPAAPAAPVLRMPTAAGVAPNPEVAHG